MSGTSFNITHKSSILANPAPTLTYSSSPTHSVILPTQQKTQKRFKSRFQKHLRKPPSFDTYLLRRTNSVSSVSSTSSCDSIISNTSTSPTEYHAIVPPQVQAQTTPHVHPNALVRRLSSAIRFSGVFDGLIPDDSSVASISYSSSSDWDPREDDNDEEEEEEEFEFINSSRNGGCHRTPSYSSAY